MYHYLSAIQKKEVVNRIVSGESITALSKEKGISRTIIYRWLMEFKKTKEAKAESLFESKRPKGDKHWRHIPGVKEEVLRIVKDDPALSPSRISQKLKTVRKEKVPSTYGIYSLMKKLRLNRYHGRLAFSEAAILIAEDTQNDKRDSKSEVKIGKSVQSHNGNLLNGVLIVSLFFLSLSVSLYTVRMAHISFPAPFAIAKKIFTGISASLPFLSKRDIFTNKLNDIKSIQNTTIEATTKPIAFSNFSGQPQNFNWGALVLNSDKSIYTMGDTVHLSFGILDSSGRTICNANLIAKVTSPLNEDSYLSMRSGSIHMRPGCGNFTKEAADYTASYAPSVIGKYEVELIAETDAGAFSQKSSFTVATLPTFSVTHEAPSRIYPPTLYPVLMDVTSNQDFTGEIREEAASQFTILPLQGTQSFQIIKRDQHSSVISWLVALKRGQSARLGYLIQTPTASPAHYALSGLVFLQADSVKFAEPTGWNLVIDSVN